MKQATFKFTGIAKNPTKAKPSAAQIAARERFAEMARSGALNRKRQIAKKANPGKKTVSQKISQLMHEGYPQKQSIAIALSEQRKGKVKANPSKFTQSQLNKLREEYSVIQGIDPGSDSYIALTKKLDALPLPLLKQLESAKIKFISSLARNRVNRAVMQKTNPASGRKGSQTQLNPVKYQDIAKGIASDRVTYSVHMPDRPSYQAMAYFTKKADALEVAQELSDRIGKPIAVSRVQVHFSKI